MALLYTNAPVNLQAQLPCADDLVVQLTTTVGQVFGLPVGAGLTPVLFLGPNSLVLAGDAVAIVHAEAAVYLTTGGTDVQWMPLNLYGLVAGPPSRQFVVQQDGVGVGSPIDASTPFMLTHAPYEQWVSLEYGGSAAAPPKVVLGRARSCAVPHAVTQPLLFTAQPPRAAIAPLVWWSAVTSGGWGPAHPGSVCSKPGWVVCANGQCMPNAEACFPYGPGTCPYGYQRCPDGTCQHAGTRCGGGGGACPYGYQRCPDGACQHAGTRCSGGPGPFPPAPIRCPSGKQPCPGGCCPVSGGGGVIGSGGRGGGGGGGGGGVIGGGGRGGGGGVIGGGGRGGGVIGGGGRGGGSHA